MKKANNNLTKKRVANKKENTISSIIVSISVDNRKSILGKISLEDAVNSRPCDCTSCGSCRCTPCK